MRAEVRRSGRRTPGEVFLEVEIPRERVLLSGFDAWHSVLNAGLIVPGQEGESDDAWWSRAEPLLDDFAARVRAAEFEAARMQDHQQWPDHLRADIEESWETIFTPATWRPREHVQAVVHEIRAAYVVKAIRIR